MIFGFSGIPDKIVEHGTPKELHKECGYDTQSIIDTVREMMKEKIEVKTIG
jgi:1-deoxy-D-xylulose-5-phosphate synthase